MKSLLKFLTVLTILLPLNVNAQELTLHVTPAELDLISEGLGTQPFNKVVPVIQKLRAQMLEQQQKLNVPTSGVAKENPESKKD